MTTGGRTSTKVLVVDDDLDVCEVVSAHLNTFGYRVECASKVDEALSRIARNRPDLALIDLMLPRTDGIELGEIAAKLGIRVVIMSGALDGEERAAVSHFPFLQKPFRAEQLRAVLDAALATDAARG